MRPNRAKKRKKRAPLHITGQQQHVGLEQDKLVWQINDGIADAYQFRFRRIGENVSEPARQVIRNDYGDAGRATSRCIGVRNLGRRARHLHSPEFFIDLPLIVVPCMQLISSPNGPLSSPTIYLIEAT